MKYILHIDTSGESGRVGLSADGILLSWKYNDEPRNHAASVNLMIEQLISDAEISLRDLASVAVCGGPGSYTGLRIGLSVAKGLCYALDIPLMQHSRLLLLCYQQQNIHSDKFTFYASVLKARDKEYDTRPDAVFCNVEPKMKDVALELVKKMLTKGGSMKLSLI
jgi:tRNA threonylcarbamoyladenosine biosynthesis protein TsaB